MLTVFWCLSSQRGVILLKVVCMNAINAAEYSMPQKYKRVYIVAYHKTTSVYKNMVKANHQDWLLKDGIHAKSFPIGFYFTF